MFPKRKISITKAHEYYDDGANALERIRNKPQKSDMTELAGALDSHFAALGAMLTELATSIDMLFERIDNLERRLR